MATAPLILPSPPTGEGSKRDSPLNLSGRLLYDGKMELRPGRNFFSPNADRAMITWLDDLIYFVQGLVPAGTFLSFEFNVHGMIAVILVSLVCGAVGSLVVAKRMAFFSDALAHCAFAGVALGLLMGVFTGAE